MDIDTISDDLRGTDQEFSVYLRRHEDALEESLFVARCIKCGYWWDKSEVDDDSYCLRCREKEAKP